MLRGEEDEDGDIMPYLHWSLTCLGHASLQASLNAKAFVEVWWSLLWRSLAKRYCIPRGREQNASAKSAGTVMEASASDLPIPVTG